MRLCWADKIPLALFALASLVLLALGATSDPSRPEWLPAFAWIEGFLFLKFALPLWIVLRVIDFLAGGPTRRVARRNTSLY